MAKIVIRESEENGDCAQKAIAGGLMVL